MCGQRYRKSRESESAYSLSHLKGALLYTHVHSGRCDSPAEPPEKCTAVARFHSHRQHLREWVSRCQNSVPGAMRTRKWHSAFSCFDHGVLICLFPPFSSRRATHTAFAFAAAERITFIHNYAAENVSAPFLLQSCAGVGACLENRDHFISYLLALVCAASSPPLPIPSFALFCYYFCVMCVRFFPLKIAVARAGKNISNNLHRIERRRKKKIESEFSWWGFDFETGSAPLELITDSTTLPKTLRTLSCISAHLAPLCSRILKRIMWVHLKKFFLTPFSSLIIF